MLLGKLLAEAKAFDFEGTKRFILFNLATTGVSALDRIVGLRQTCFVINKDGEVAVEKAATDLLREDITPAEHAKSYPYHDIPLSVFRDSGLPEREFALRVKDFFKVPGTYVTYAAESKGSFAA